MNRPYLFQFFRFLLGIFYAVAFFLIMAVLLGGTMALFLG